MKRNDSKRDERHGWSRHRPTKVLESCKVNLATLKVATKCNSGRTDHLSEKLKEQISNVHRTMPRQRNLAQPSSCKKPCKSRLHAC